MTRPMVGEVPQAPGGGCARCGSEQTAISVRGERFSPGLLLQRTTPPPSPAPWLAVHASGFVCLQCGAVEIVANDLGALSGSSANQRC